MELGISFVRWDFFEFPWSVRVDTIDVALIINSHLGQEYTTGLVYHIIESTCPFSPHPLESHPAVHIEFGTTDPFHRN